MKNLILGLALLLTYGLSAQSVNGVNLEDLDQPFIDLLCVSNSGLKYSMQIDYGQKNKAMSLKPVEVAGKDGRTLIVNSPIQALNLMKKYGYTVHEIYSESKSSNLFRRYLLVKED